MLEDRRPDIRCGLEPIDDVGVMPTLPPTSAGPWGQPSLRAEQQHVDDDGEDRRQGAAQDTAVEKDRWKPEQDEGAETPLPISEVTVTRPIVVTVAIGCRPAIAGKASGSSTLHRSCRRV